jgi:hypothetical protein
VALWAWLLEHHRVSRAAGWAASLAATIAMFQGTSFVALPGALGPVCQGNSPVTCLDRSHESTIGRYRDAIARLWISIPVPLRPAVVGSGEDVVPDGATNVLIVPPVAGYTEPSRVIDQTMFAARMGDVLFLQPCSGNNGKFDTARSLVLWWRMQNHVSNDGPAFPGDGSYRVLDPEYEKHYSAARAFARTAEEARASWFQKNAQRVRNCTAPALADS